VSVDPEDGTTGAHIDPVGLLPGRGGERPDDDIRVRGFLPIQQDGEGTVRPEHDVGESEGDMVFADKGTGALDAMYRTERPIGQDIRELEPHAVAVRKVGEKIPFSGPGDDKNPPDTGLAHRSEQARTDGLESDIFVPCRLDRQ
jgi:hypothetical protein